MRTARIYLTYLALILGLCGSANAATIFNLSDDKQMIEIETPTGYKTISIEAGQFYRRTGDMRVKFRGLVSYIEDNEEYAIWSRDTFGPQQTFRIKGRR